MKENEVRERAFAMPLTSPAYPLGPYRFVNREFLIITYRTDPEKLRALVPEPLEVERAAGEIRVHPHAGFDRLRRLHRERAGHPGLVPGPQGRLHPLHVPQRPAAHRRRPRAVGLSQEARRARRSTTEIDTLVGTLDYGPVRVATGTMGYKHKQADLRRSQGVARSAELPAQDHSARRRHAAHLRAGRVPSRGRRR